MGKILFTSKTPFDMRDWAKRTDILEVYAGMNCIMARCSDGTVLRKSLVEGRVLNTYTMKRYLQAGSFSTDDEELRGWKKVRQISISVQYPGLAIGVTPEGNCVALLPVSKIDEDDATEIISFLSGFHDVSEVSASNEIFVLTRDGRVHQWTFPSRRKWDKEIDSRTCYLRCSTWRNIVHIHGGHQSICGINKDGTAFLSYPWDSRLKKAEQYKNICDVYPAGSDDEIRYLVQNNGNMIDSFSSEPHLKDIDKLVGCVYEVLAITRDQRIEPVQYILARDEIISWRKIVSSAIGLYGFSPEKVYILAVTDDEDLSTDECNEAAIKDYSKVGKELRDGFNCHYRGYTRRRFNNIENADGSLNAKRLYVDGDIETIYEYTSICVPKEVSYHSGGNFYWLCNLKEIIAHPDSPYYYSYDGALYRKDSGDLACVPMGKRILHIAANSTIRQLFFYPYIPFSLPNLEEIIVDGESDFLCVRNGSLFSRDLKYLYYVPRKSKVLYIAKETESIQFGALGHFSVSVNTVGANPFREIENNEIETIAVENENKLFAEKGNCLFSADFKRLYYAPPKGGKLFIARETELIDKNVLLNTYQTIEVEDGNMSFSTKDGGLFNKDYTKMFLPPRQVQEHELIIPKDVKEIYSGVLHKQYDRIVVEQGNEVYRDFRGFLLKKCDSPHRSIALRYLVGKSGCYPIMDYEIVVPYTEEACDIDQAISKLNLRDGIKPGTEELFLGLFLSNKEHFLFGRDFKLSTFRILMKLIEKNELAWMHRVIEDHRLITKRNISRLIRSAELNGSKEMVNILKGLKDLPEKIEIE